MRNEKEMIIKKYPKEVEPELAVKVDNSYSTELNKSKDLVENVKDIDSIHRHNMLEKGIINKLSVGLLLEDIIDFLIQAGIFWLTIAAMYLIYAGIM